MNYYKKFIAIFCVCLLAASMKNFASFSNDYETAKAAYDYWENLKRRQNKPENEEAYYKKLTAAREYHDKTGDDSKEREVLHDSWKKTWWERNPGTGDAVIAGMIVVGCAGLLAGSLYAFGRTMIYIDSGQ